uniref:Choriogenin H n=1 Tax=Steinernema glaseri TaxID=37863 RepID=A0A1I7YUI4_9BILA
MLGSRLKLLLLVAQLCFGVSAWKSPRTVNDTLPVLPGLPFLPTKYAKWFLPKPKTPFRDTEPGKALVTGIEIYLKASSGISGIFPPLQVINGFAEGFLMLANMDQTPEIEKKVGELQAAVGGLQNVVESGFHSLKALIAKNSFYEFVTVPERKLAHALSYHIIGQPKNPNRASFREVCLHNAPINIMQALVDSFKSFHYMENILQASNYALSDFIELKGTVLRLMFRLAAEAEFCYMMEDNSTEVQNNRLKEVQRTYAIQARIEKYLEHGAALRKKRWWKDAFTNEVEHYVTSSDDLLKNGKQSAAERIREYIEYKYGWDEEPRRQVQRFAVFVLHDDSTFEPNLEVPSEHTTMFKWKGQSTDVYIYKSSFDGNETAGNAKYYENRLTYSNNSHYIHKFFTSIKFGGFCTFGFARYYVADMAQRLKEVVPKAQKDYSDLFYFWRTAADWKRLSNYGASLGDHDEPAGVMFHTYTSMLICMVVYPRPNNDIAINIPIQIFIGF